MARYEEQRQIHAHEQAYKADLDQIKDLQTAPNIDDLSKQIVNLMDDRKEKPAHERLYATGKAKLREVKNRS